MPPISSNCTLSPTRSQTTLPKWFNAQYNWDMNSPPPPFPTAPARRITTECLNIHQYGHLHRFLNKVPYLFQIRILSKVKMDIFSLSWHFSVLLKNDQTPRVNQPSCNSTYYLVLISSMTNLDNTSRKGFWFKMKWCQRSDCTVFEIRLLTTPAWYKNFNYMPGFTVQCLFVWI